MTGRSFVLIRMTVMAACGLGLAAGVSCSTAPAQPAPTAEYDATSGRLRLLAQDSDGDGKHDTFMHMDGTRLLRIEHDPDGDGRISRWDFFAQDRTVESVGLSRQNDGVMDWQAFYAPDGSLMRLALSTRRDGVFDRVEVYRSGVLVRTEEDTDFDGRVDKWDTYRVIADAETEEWPYAVTSTLLDESGSGRPERRFIFGPNGSIARIEVYPHIGTDWLR